MKPKTKQTLKKRIIEDFDPVKMMRDIRSKLAKKIEGMTFEQENLYLTKLLVGQNKLQTK